jgi:predicted ArsR family transcriptional regulator
MAPQGASVEALCAAAGVTHNAVRQHLSALMAAGWVGHGQALASGGRPQARYVLLPAGRDLFPRNYGLIATGILERLYASIGKAGVQALLVEMGHELGAAAATHIDTVDDGDIATALAGQLDALGYEATTVQRDGETQVEAYNCVFHTVARTHPDVCRFDLAFMEAATGRRIQHAECLLRGGHACRFRIQPKRGDKS